MEGSEEFSALYNRLLDRDCVRFQTREGMLEVVHEARQRNALFEDKLDLGMEPEAWRLGRTADEHLKRLERDGLTGRRGRE